MHPPAGANAHLRIDILRKSFRTSNGGTLDVLQDLHIEIDENEFVCVIGPSGCGKTTALRVLLGLDRSFEGTIQLPGTEYPRIGAVFQEPLLLPWRTIEENVRLALPKSIRGKNLDALFATLGLSKMRSFFPAELSLGLARRAAIARALAIEPDLLVLDEPFVSLDEATANQLRHLLLAVWSERPTTALMVTHNLREAIMLSDKIIVLSQRPSHVVGSFVIRIPREKRSELVRNDLLRAFKEKFPDQL